MIFESGFIPNLRERVEDYGNFEQPRQRWYFIRDLQRSKATSKTHPFEKFEGLTDVEAEDALNASAPTDYIGATRALYQTYARTTGATRWGDKTPRYTLHIDYLSTAFPDSRFIHFLRDPRDVARSICSAGWAQDLADGVKSGSVMFRPLRPTRTVWASATARSGSKRFWKILRR